MKNFNSVLLAVALLGAARGVNGQDPAQKGSAESADCLADFNTARERADLEAFTAETNEEQKMPIKNESYIKALQPIALQRVSGFVELSCPSPAYVNFGELPSKYEKEETGVYAESRNRSLVALYNPKEGATVDCAYITCPASTATSTTTTSTTAQSSQETTPNPSDSGQNQENGSNRRRLSASSETVTGLVCLTNPAALEAGHMPFSEEIWANIKEAIESSASASTQSALLATALFLLTSFVIL
ncbi:SAG family member [Eimeria mitis]|uniref:SAG family member n=1 Tax=Eimeria mitis TaxID=44415 RepID=U6KD72_9EIME|nr:SAG family member [Eimeria mitis]CDJ34202.1 SAG family member [Eimeria mitis]